MHCCSYVRQAEYNIIKFTKILAAQITSVSRLPRLSDPMKTDRREIPRGQAKVHEIIMP